MNTLVAEREKQVRQLKGRVSRLDAEVREATTVRKEGLGALEAVKEAWSTELLPSPQP